LGEGKGGKRSEGMNEGKRRNTVVIKFLFVAKYVIRDGRKEGW